MSHKTLDSRHSIESFTRTLQSWTPFQQLHTTPKVLDPDCTKHHHHTATSASNGSGKRQCLADRATSFSVDALDMSKLSLFEDDRPPLAARKTDGLGLIVRKRRRRGSRSVSGRSSDRSGTRRRYCSAGASAAHGTCSDFPAAMGTDSSGELFVNGDANWSSDVCEVARNSRREKDGGSGERDNSSVAFAQAGNCNESQGNESGYGSEPGYRGDAEFGYGDEFDEEEDYPRLLFWGNKLGATLGTKHRLFQVQILNKICNKPVLPFQIWMKLVSTRGRRRITEAGVRRAIREWFDLVRWQVILCVVIFLQFHLDVPTAV